MLNGTCFQTYSPCSSEGEQGGWKNLATTMSAYPTGPHQRPDLDHLMRYSFGRGGLDSSVPTAPGVPLPVSASTSLLESEIPYLLPESPAELLLNDFDADPALQLHNHLDTAQSWTVPAANNPAPFQPFMDYTGADLFSVLNCGLPTETGGLPIPPATLSATSSVHSTLDLHVLNGTNALLCSPTPPSSLPTASDSPVAPTSPLPTAQGQLVCSEPSCKKVFANRSDLKCVALSPPTVVIHNYSTKSVTPPS